MVGLAEVLVEGLPSTSSVPRLPEGSAQASESRRPAFIVPMRRALVLTVRNSGLFGHIAHVFPDKDKTHSLRRHRQTPDSEHPLKGYCVKSLFTPAI